MTLVGKQIADGRVLKLTGQMLKAGYEEKGQRYEIPRGTPQGDVISPLLSNILLTSFDKEMRHQGYQLTRWADDWVVTCRTRAEAKTPWSEQQRILEKLGVTLNREKTRIVHIAQGFEFLGFKIQRGKGQFKLTRDRIKSTLNRRNLYAIPTQKSVDRFKDQIRNLTKRQYASANGWVDQHDQPDHPRMGKLLLSLPCQKALQSAGSLDNPKALVASHQAMAKYRLEGISHEKAAHGVQASQPCRTNTLASDRESPFIKAGCGKTARPVCAADGGEPFNRRLLRPDSCEADEQSRATGCGVGGAKGGDRGECGPAKHGPGTEPDKRVTGAGTHTASRKAKEEGEVHRALPPHQHRSPRGGVLRTQGERCTRSRWADVEGLRGRPRAQSRGSA